MSSSSTYTAVIWHGRDLIRRFKYLHHFGLINNFANERSFESQ